jgi:hypothetical protein
VEMATISAEEAAEMMEKEKKKVMKSLDLC